MTTINLKRYYPYMTENVMLEVSDGIAATLSMGGRLCDCFYARFHIRGFNIKHIRRQRRCVER